MTSMAEALPRSPFSAEPNYSGPRHVPILPSSTSTMTVSQSDSMDITPPASSVMGPPSHNSPEVEQDGGSTGSGTQAEAIPTTNGGASNGNLNAAAAATSQQPKVVQTAFIHKLYKSVVSSHAAEPKGLTLVAAC
jgi:hypothetical protein